MRYINVLLTYLLTQLARFLRLSSGQGISKVESPGKNVL